MLKTMTVLINGILIILLLSTIWIPLASAGNECRIIYGWNTGNTFNGTFKNHTRDIYLNRGQTKTINRSRLNFVKNLRNNKVRFFLQNASSVTLGKDQRNPVAGTYVSNVKLTKVKCITPPSSSSSSNSSNSNNITMPASPGALLQTLKSQGVAVKQIAQQLKSTFNQNANQVASLLKGANYSMKNVAEALKYAFPGDQGKRAFFMAFKSEAISNNSVSSQFVQFAKGMFYIHDISVGEIARGAAFTANDTVRLLKEGYKYARPQIKAILTAAKYKQQEIDAALMQWFGPVVGAAPVPNQGSSIPVAIIDAGIREMRTWFKKAEISGRLCRVNGAIAKARPGVLTSRHQWKGYVKTALKANGYGEQFAQQWDQAFKASFTGWARQVTIPALAWYPLFIYIPNPEAPPTPNVPTPLASLISSGMPGMTPAGLGKAIKQQVGNAVSVNATQAIKQFSVEVGRRFEQFQAKAMVTNVIGSGKVPSYQGGIANPAGPVVNGTCSGKERIFDRSVINRM